MDAIEPFIVLEQYRLAVCQKCGFAMVAQEVFTHLKVRHKDIPVPRRREIEQAISKYPAIIQDQNGLHDFRFPPPTISYIPHLAPPERDGLKCRRCPYIARQLQKIQAHYRTRHGWQNSRSAGRPDLKRKRSPVDDEVGVNATDTLAELPWRENVACQRFFPSRLASGWFEISRLSLPSWAQPMYAPDTLMPTITQLTPPNRKKSRKSDLVTRAVDDHIAAILQRRDQHIHKQKESRLYAETLGEGSLTAISPWLDRTRWHEMYKGVRRDILKGITSIPKHTGDLYLGRGDSKVHESITIPHLAEQKIAYLIYAVDLMLNRCERTTNNTSRLIQYWLVTSKLNSYQANAFSVMTEPSTRYRYRQTWKQFIAFIVQAWLLPSRIRKQVKVAVPSKIQREIQVL
ncbi:hypothetical protein PWT90_08726 [Aphanocladium album]|nr:hypothetical protein PWT90_08726 [Aphanocladium album]